MNISACLYYVIYLCKLEVHYHYSLIQPIFLLKWVENVGKRTGSAANGRLSPASRPSNWRWSTIGPSTSRACAEWSWRSCWAWQRHRSKSGFRIGERRTRESRRHRLINNTGEKIRYFIIYFLSCFWLSGYKALASQAKGPQFESTLSVKRNLSLLRSDAQ